MEMFLSRVLAAKWPWYGVGSSWFHLTSIYDFVFVFLLSVPNMGLVLLGFMYLYLYFVSYILFLNDPDMGLVFPGFM